MINTFEEFVFFGALALWTFLKNAVREEKFIRPCLLFMIIFILLGSTKFNEIEKNVNIAKKQIVSYIKKF